MQTPFEIETKAQNVKEALENHLGVKGRTLRQSLRRAGRRLPKKLRDQAKVLADAEAVSGNIKLVRQFDAAGIERAYDDVSEHLEKIDRADARRARLVSILAALAFNFIVLFAAFVVFLRYRGTI